MLGGHASGLNSFIQKVIGEPGRTLSAAGNKFRAIAVTIRGKILLAFCAMAAITGLLGNYAVHSVADSGRLVVKTYDQPLMAISYARLALSIFTEMKLAFMQRTTTIDVDQQQMFDKKIARLLGSLKASLGVAEQRSLSREAAGASHKAVLAVTKWDTTRKKLVSGTGDPETKSLLNIQASAVVSSIDSLVEFTATDGFRHREQALASIESYYYLSIFATIGAIFFSVVIAVFLARQMMRPIAAASHTASRIAEGDLDVDIRPEGNDELGQLLGSMAIMRDNIRDMMQREIDARMSAQTRLVNAIESSAEGVVLVDAEGQILRANSQMMKFFPELEQAFEEGALLPAELESVLTRPTHSMHLADGRWLRLSRSDTADHDFVIICSDITALKERETVLQAAKDQAEAANRSKSQFLANMNHELRTPLNAVIGFSEIIRDAMVGPVSARYQEYARDICSSGEHLLSMINDTLDFSKIEEGQLEIYEEVVDVPTVIRACHRIIRERIQKNNLDLVTDVHSNLPPLRADQRRLKQIFLNLLANAVKFTPELGQITITARLTPTDQIEIAIADTGIGMTPEEVTIAMEPFRQVDGELNRRYQGTGLGLPLVQRLVDLHDGQLDIVTAPDAGTTITITLPAARSVLGNAATNSLQGSA